MTAPKTKQELMIIALQQRIGELVTQYETHIASLRADLTQLKEITDIVSSSENKEDV